MTIEHFYLSTGCLHGDHAYCEAMTGVQGEKRPASCKQCSGGCHCPRHADPAAPCGPPPEWVEWRVRYPDTSGTRVLSEEDVRSVVARARAAGVEAVAEYRIAQPWQVAADKTSTAPPD